VEFALVLPLILVIALALVQVGLLVRDRLLVEAAARAGARTAALQPDLSAAHDAAVAAAPALDPARIAVSVQRAGTQGDPVTVTIAYTAAIRVPLVSWLFGSGVTMDASATDRQEFA
jgi:Flp pilus assembly protein TadG